MVFPALVIFFYFMSIIGGNVQSFFQNVVNIRCRVPLEEGKIEPVHDKTNKMTCAPSEASDQPGYLPSNDSDQLGHLRSLIRVFTVGMKKDWALS